MSTHENIEQQIQDTSLDDGFDLHVTDKVPKGNSHNKISLDRRVKWFNDKFNFSPDALCSHVIDPKKLRGVVENFIGAVQVPVGLAGPLLINGDVAKGVFMAPFATVEGVITLSATRGAQVINASGGIRTKALKRQMIRAPIFKFANLAECEIFVAWVKENFETIQTECNKLSRHGRLQSIDEFIIGNEVHLRFCFTTGNAAGQNMVTIMTDNGCIWIRDEFPKQSGVDIRFYAVDGNLAGDKKINHMNFASARGSRVVAEVFLKKEAFESIFNCSMEKFITAADAGNHGNLLAGTPGGLSINSVNVIAAIYAATGQDLACVYESGAQQIQYEAREDGIYWSSTYSSLVTGTISNAQRLPTQQECLKMLGCTGEDSAEKLAEIIAAFSVALDISTLASIANDTFANAHRLLGRS